MTHPFLLSRTTAVITVAATAALGLVACSGSDSASTATQAGGTSSTAAKKSGGGSGVDIEYWHRLPDKDGMIKVADAAQEFNKSHPGITVKTVKFEGDATKSYDKITAAIKAGNAPCLAQASYNDLPAMLVRGELMDVTSLASQYKDNYAPGPWTQVSLGGKTYGLPQDTGPLVYFYDKDAFDKLGIKAPTTWDEYWANAEKAKAAGKYSSAFFKDDAGDWYGAINAAHGEKWFTIDGSSWKVNINSDQSKKIAANWQTSIDDKSTLAIDRWGSPSPTDTALKNGELIGYIGASWEASWNLDALGKEKANWRVAQLPGDKTGPWGGSGIVVLKNCQHPKDALEYANWYNTNLKDMVSQGLVPAAKGEAKTEPKVAALYGGQDVQKALSEATDISNPTLYSPTWPAVKKVFEDQAGKNATLDSILNAAQDEAVKSLEAKGLTVEK